MLECVVSEIRIDLSLLERAQTDEVKSILMHNTQAAADRGAFGIPTFFFGVEIFFGKERLGQVEEELASLRPGASEPSSSPTWTAV